MVVRVLVNTPRVLLNLLSAERILVLKPICFAVCYVVITPRAIGYRIAS